MVEIDPFVPLVLASFVPAWALVQFAVEDIDQAPCSPAAVETEAVALVDHHMRIAAAVAGWD